MIGRRTRHAGTLLAASLWLAPLPAQAPVQSFLDGLFGGRTRQNDARGGFFFSFQAFDDDAVV